MPKIYYLKFGVNTMPDLHNLHSMSQSVKISQFKNSCLFLASGEIHEQVTGEVRV